MRLVLGAHVYDVTSRALVIGVLELVPGQGDGPPSRGPELDDYCRRAEQSLSDGADVLEVGGHDPGAVIAALHARFEVPLICATERAEVARVALDAGAAAVRCGAGSAGTEYLAEVAEAGASVTMVPGPSDGIDVLRRSVISAATRAESAGVPAERILFDIGGRSSGGAGPEAALRRTSALVDLGYGLTLSWASPSLVPPGATPDPEHGREATIAVWILAVMAGCRVLRTNDGRGARRVADVLAALLDAGDER